jgi:hypothetical protein
MFAQCYSVFSSKYYRIENGCKHYGKSKIPTKDSDVQTEFQNMAFVYNSNIERYNEILANVKGAAKCFDKQIHQSWGQTTKTISVR